SGCSLLYGTRKFRRLSCLCIVCSGGAVRRLWLVLAFVGVAGCATLNPQPGMSFEEWKRMAAKSGSGGPELIGMKGTVSVYRLNGMTNHNTFYWFDKGQLYQVTQGELPQIRYQIEMIQR